MQATEERKVSSRKDVGQMMAIVTVRLQRNPNHNSAFKRTGKCPIDGRLCTDITGSHHSYIETGFSLMDIQSKARRKGFHITRVEVIEE